MLPKYRGRVQRQVAGVEIGRYGRPYGNLVDQLSNDEGEVFAYTTTVEKAHKTETMRGFFGGGTVCL